MTPRSAPVEEASALLGAVVRLLRTSRSIGHRRALALGPSGTPYAVLKALLPGGARPGDLAAQLGVSPSVISRALQPLEQRGLIRRHHDAEDARAWLVSLSDTGRQTLEAQHNEYVRLLADALTDCPPEELRRATDALERVENVFATRMDDLKHGVAAPALRDLGLPAPGGNGPDHTGTGPGTTVTPDSPETTTTPVTPENHQPQMENA